MYRYEYESRVPLDHSYDSTWLSIAIVCPHISTVVESI